MDHAVLCEIDPGVAAVWKVVFSESFEELCNKITNFKIDRDRVIEVVEREPASLLDRAFQTIVRNRTFRGGILARGASLIKSGENGRGISSRWYPETLVRRICVLNRLSDRITFIEGNGMEILGQFAEDESAFIFVDPPYTAGRGKRAGSRLYAYSELDHKAVFETLALGRAAFMMTYDDDIEVLQMSKRNGFVLQHVGMKNAHHRCMSELLITRD